MRVKIIKCTFYTKEELERTRLPKSTKLCYHDKIGQEFDIDERYHVKAEGEFYSPVFITWIDGKEYGIFPDDCIVVEDTKLPNEIRCPNCNRKLGEYTGHIQWISLKCHNCKTITEKSNI